MGNKNFENNLHKLGGISGIYFATAYIVMMIVFVLIIDYPSITSQSEKIEMFINNKTAMYLSYLTAYVIFGLLLVVFSLAIYERLKDKSPNAAKVSAVYGIMWGCLLVGGGMLYIKGISTAIDMYSKNAEQAITVWTTVETTALGITFSEGEIIGGLWSLIISVAGLKTREFKKSVCIVGIIAGISGILSIIPVINVLGGTAIFGITQIIWYTFMGISLLKGSKELSLREKYE